MPKLSSKPLRFLVRAAIVAGLAFGLADCQKSYDPPSELRTLRVLGVEKDLPYAQKGETVSLTMLWHDGSPQAAPGNPDGRRVELGWFGPCVNPPGDSYATCGAAIGRQLGNDDPSDDPSFGTGPTFQVKFPDRADTLHPNQDPKQPDYGLMYVFFAACAGKLDFQLPTAPGATIASVVRCRDEAGNNLLSDDFVLGYSAIYGFEAAKNYRNQNPVVTGFWAKGQDVTDVSCVGDACLGTCDDESCENQPPTVTPDDAETYCAAYPSLCMPPCKDDGNPDKCTGYKIAPVVDKAASLERDQISYDAYGNDYSEQMWIDYYVSNGSITATKLLNDATGGWNDDFGTEFYPPKEKGPVQAWAVVHDNRGGMSWSGVTLLVR